MSMRCSARSTGSPYQAVVPDSSMPAARLDMRPAVVETPTVEADTVPGCLDRLTLATARTRSASLSAGFVILNCFR